MRNAVQSMLNAVDRDNGGVAIIWCPDLGLRDWLVEEVEALVPSVAAALHVTDVESALREPNRLILLIPANEREAILDLDGSRDRILEGTGRTQPIIVFLLREGDGQTTLAAHAPSLRSWIAGSDADPEKLAAVDVAHERTAFENEHGKSPEAWLADWRNGGTTPTAANFRVAFDATLLADLEPI